MPVHDVPEPEDHREAAAQATRSLQGLSTELTARVPRLLEAMRSVGTGLELHSALDRICETAAELADARYAAIGVVDQERDGLSDFVTYGVTQAQAQRIGRLPDGHQGLLGALVEHPEPVLLGDLTTDPRFAGFPAHHPVMRTFLGVPIRVQGEIFGNLYLAEKNGGAEFSDYDLHMVRVLATEAGIAIGNARLYEAARQRERWIDGSVAVTTALLSGGDADDALTVVAQQDPPPRRLGRGDGDCCPPRRAVWRSSRSRPTTRPSRSAWSFRRRVRSSRDSSTARPCSSATRPATPS